MAFEQSLNKLEEISKKIRSEETSLDDAIKCYEDGIKEYGELKKVLDETREKISVFEK